jgi:hypothetical protein
MTLSSSPSLSPHSYTYSPTLLFSPLPFLHDILTLLSFLLVTARSIIECIRRESRGLTNSTYTLVVELLNNTLRTNPIAVKFFLRVIESKKRRDPILKLDVFVLLVLIGRPKERESALKTLAKCIQSNTISLDLLRYYDSSFFTFLLFLPFLSSCSFIRSAPSFPSCSSAYTFILPFSSVLSLLFVALFSECFKDKNALSSCSSSLLFLCENLLTSKKQYLGEWAQRLYYILFVEYENCRPEVLLPSRSRSSLPFLLLFLLLFFSLPLF